MLGDLNFLFKCSTRYFTIMSSLCSLLRNWFEHKKIRNFIFPSSHVLLCLFYKYTNNKAFDDFLKISNHFLKIFSMPCKGHANISKLFPRLTISRQKWERMAHIWLIFDNILVIKVEVIIGQCKCSPIITEMTYWV